MINREDAESVEHELLGEWRLTTASTHVWRNKASLYHIYHQILNAIMQKRRRKNRQTVQERLQYFACREGNILRAGKVLRPGNQTHEDTSDLLFMFNATWCSSYAPFHCVSFIRVGCRLPLTRLPFVTFC